MIETTFKEMSMITWLTLASVEMNYDDKQKSRKQKEKIEQKIYCVALLKTSCIAFQL